jgi:VanZ family protein
MAVIFLFSSMPGLRSPFEALFDLIIRKLAHIGEYAILTFLLIRALNLHGLSFRRVILVTVCVSTLYAVSDEAHQTFVPGRNGVLSDVVIDGVGILVAVAYTRTQARRG